MSRTYTSRKTLINQYGKELLNRLATEFPAYSWYLTMMEGRAVCIGFKGKNPAIIGTTYEDIVANLTL